MILITGATGHVGNTLIHDLARQGEEIRLFLPGNEPVKALDGLKFELITGDISDLPKVQEACKGVKQVYHLAGLVDISPKDAQRLELVNVTGTKNIVQACLDQKVERLVYVSSVHAIPEPPKGTAITEVDASAFPNYELMGPYALSKSAATAAVYEGIKKGLDAVILFPSGIIGPGDYRGSEMGKVISFLLGKTKSHTFACFNGEYNFVDVRDVSIALQKAMQLGRKGEGYLISGHSMSIPELYRKVLFVMGKSSIKLIMFPLTLVMFAAKIVLSFARLLKKKPFFTPYSISVLQSNSKMDGSKAERELGFKARPIDETLIETVRWLQARKAAGYR